MKKKGSFLSGLVVFFLIIVILGGVGYLGFNIIKNANGMPGMNMVSDKTSTDAGSTNTAGNDAKNETANTENNSQANAQNAYKINQINQIVANREALSKAYETISSALDKMTLDPYSADTDKSSSMNDPSMDNMKSDTAASGDSQEKTTINIYNDSVSGQESTQMQSMGQTYDAVKMQQLHSGLYKVSVGMQLLDLLQDDIAGQIEKAGVDTSSKTEFYMNQYYKTVQNKSKLKEALTYINEAVDLININPYVDANGLVYDEERMAQLHDSIYIIAQGVVDLNRLNDNMLTQAVDIGTLAQNAYNESQQNQNNMGNMNMSASSGLNITNIITIVLIAFVVIFIIALLGSIIKLFKSGSQKTTTDNLA